MKLALSSRTCRQRLQPAVSGALLCLAFAVAPVAAQNRENNTPTSGAQADEHRVFVMDERPSFRLGDLRLDITTKVDLELRHSSDVEVDTVGMEHRRIGVDGRFGDVLGFQVEGELADRDQVWRDVYLELRKWRAVRVRGGQFKIPFGQERLTSISDLDFARRSIPTEALAPGRDIGIEMNGRLFDRTLTYMAGVFRRDGDGWREEGNAGLPSPGTIAGRVVGTPLAWTSARALQRIELGFGFTHGEVPEGLNGVRARTVNGYEAFAPLYVFGNRQRLGVDAAFSQGPVAIRGEYLQLVDQRTRQGLADEDLPDVSARGWHVTATSFVWGRLRAGGTAPRAAVGRGGIGAIQLAGRLESLTFDSDADWDAELRNPRAPHVLSNDIRAATVGVNWYPLRFVKVQLNLIRERLQDPERRPDPESSWITSGVLRFQFAM
jgi:phosphate-selective porin OprO/OprP